VPAQPFGRVARRVPHRARARTRTPLAGVSVQIRSVKGPLTVAMVVLALWVTPLGLPTRSGAVANDETPTPSGATGTLDPTGTPDASAIAAGPTGSSEPSSTGPSGSGAPGPGEPQPTPGSTGTLTPSGPIVVTQSGTTIDGVVIASRGRSGIGIWIDGTSDRPVRNVTIRNCAILGFNVGIEARHVTNLVIENCTVSGANYAGIAVYSGTGGRIAGNTIRDIGTDRTDLSVPFVGNNAYGITLDRNALRPLSSDPPSSDFVLTNNLIDNIPLWMGINTHAGVRLTITKNVIRATPRAIFIAGDNAGNPPRDVTISGNRLEDAETVPGGTADIEGILISKLQGGSITDNEISRTFGVPGVFDYLGQSVDVKMTGQRSIP
jgi:parallel beta-helix repeat protein